MQNANTVATTHCEQTQKNPGTSGWFLRQLGSIPSVPYCYQYSLNNNSNIHCLQKSGKRCEATLENTTVHIVAPWEKVARQLSKTQRFILLRPGKSCEATFETQRFILLRPGKSCEATFETQRFILLRPGKSCEVRLAISENSILTVSILRCFWFAIPV